MLVDPTYLILRDDPISPPTPNLMDSGVSQHQRWGKIPQNTKGCLRCKAFAVQPCQLASENVR